MVADVGNTTDQAITVLGISMSNPLSHEDGGLETDISGYEGLVRISGGVTSYVVDHSNSWDGASTLVYAGTASKCARYGADGVLTAASGDCAAGGGGSGDMTKVVYDTDNSTTVDAAEDVTCNNCLDTDEIDETNVDHDTLNNFDVNEHFTQANITETGTVASGTWQGSIIDHERGGLEADVSAYDGLVKISGGVTSAITDNSTVWDAAHVTTSGVDTMIAAHSASASALYMTSLETDASITVHSNDASAHHVATVNTNANTECSGNTTYYDGEGNCDDISGTYMTEGCTDCVTASEIADTTTTDTKCANIDPDATTTDWLLLRVDVAVTITGVDCIVDAATSVVMTLQECDGNGGSCVDIEAAITCATTNTTESSGIDNASIDAGDWIRVTRGTKTGSPTQATICWTYTVDD